MQQNSGSQNFMIMTIRWLSFQSIASALQQNRTVINLPPHRNHTRNTPKDFQQTIHLFV